MKSLVSTVAAIAALTLMATGTASAKHYVQHRPFGTMTAKQREHWYVRQISHDRGAIAWLSQHLTAPPLPGHARFLTDQPRAILTLQRQAQIARWSHELVWYKTSLRITTAHLAALRASFVPLILRERGLGLPPAWYLRDIHCIERGESTYGAGSSNLYGMLDGWKQAGGTGYAGDAPAQEQLYRTWILWNWALDTGKNPWSPWTTAPGCGLRSSSR